MRAFRSSPVAARLIHARREVAGVRARDGGVGQGASSARSSILAAIAITLGGGYYTYEAAPPYPGQVVAQKGGELLFDKENILTGQAVWQKYGLMDLGSIWGHGT